MAHRGYSSWDRVTGTGRKVPVLEREPGEGKAQARCRARIDAFRSTIDDCETEAAPLARELKMRRDFWRGQFSPHGNLEKMEKQVRRSPNRMVLQMGLYWIPFIVVAALLSFVPVLFGARPFWHFLGFVFMALWMMAFGLCIRPSFRVRRTLVFSLCPDCEYSLGELPDTIEFSNGERTGPAICPECGCPWPLVPPRPPA